MCCTIASTSDLQKSPFIEVVNAIHTYLNEINICFNYRRLEGERSIKRCSVVA
jgi:hypothetical protein